MSRRPVSPEPQGVASGLASDYRALMTIIAAGTLFMIGIVFMVGLAIAAAIALIRMK